MLKALYECKLKRLQALMNDMEEVIQTIRDEMDEVITFCLVLSGQSELLISIDGVWWNQCYNYDGSLYTFR